MYLNDFAGVSKNTYDISWRATTVPYGFARQAREHELYLGIYIYIYIYI
jgi:hypothetical protein